MEVDVKVVVETVDVLEDLVDVGVVKSESRPGVVVETVDVLVASVIVVVDTGDVLVDIVEVVDNVEEVVVDGVDVLVETVVNGLMDVLVDFVGVDLCSL